MGFLLLLITWRPGRARQSASGEKLSRQRRVQRDGRGVGERGDLVDDDAEPGGVVAGGREVGLERADRARAARFRRSAATSPRTTSRCSARIAIRSSERIT